LVEGIGLGTGTGTGVELARGSANFGADESRATGRGWGGEETGGELGGGGGGGRGGEWGGGGGELRGGGGRGRKISTDADTCGVRNGFSSSSASPYRQPSLSRAISSYDALRRASETLSLSQGTNSRFNSRSSSRSNSQPQPQTEPQTQSSLAPALSYRTSNEFSIRKNENARSLSPARNQGTTPILLPYYRYYSHTTPILS